MWGAGINKVLTISRLRLCILSLTGLAMGFGFRAFRAGLGFRFKNFRAITHSGFGCKRVDLGLLELMRLWSLVFCFNVLL